MGGRVSLQFTPVRPRVFSPFLTPIWKQPQWGVYEVESICLHRRYVFTMPWFTNLYPPRCNYSVRVTALHGIAQQSPGKEVQTLFLGFRALTCMLPMAIVSLPPGQPWNTQISTTIHLGTPTIKKGDEWQAFFQICHGPPHEGPLSDSHTECITSTSRNFLNQVWGSITEFKSHLFYLLARWFSVSYLSPLCFSFLISITGITILPLS